jgi:hypothetical protein
MRFMVGSTVAELKKVSTTKSGKGDLASAWCIARLEQVEQGREQFALGESVPIGGDRVHRTSEKSTSGPI